MPDSFLEIELRYKLKDVQSCIKRLESHGLIAARTERLIDEWYIPRSIKSLPEEITWFDRNQGIAWRIRRATKGNGESVLNVASKQLTADNNHNSFHETTATFNSYEEATDAMDARDYRNWLTLDKTRYFLTSTNSDISNTEFELIIDEIAGLADKIGIGACLEIEFKGIGERDAILKKIEKTAASVGFTKDDQFEKSLTTSSMTELAQFE